MRRVSFLAAALVAAGIAAATSVGTASATPTCAHWKVSPSFSADMEDGLTVTFTLHQSGQGLSGTASFTETHPEKNIYGQATNSTTYGDVIAASSHLAGGRFLTRVRWTNGATETYTGTLSPIVTAKNGGLYAGLGGKTNVQGAIALVAWHTRTGMHAVKALTCLPADTHGH